MLQSSDFLNVLLAFRLSTHVIVILILLQVTKLTFHTISFFKWRRCLDPKIDIHGGRQCEDTGEITATVSQGVTEVATS